LPIGKAFSQSLPEPAVVISIAKFDEQMKDVNYLLTASGFAQMKFMAGAVIKGYTKGLDSKRDAGVLLYLSEGKDEPDFLGFAPVDDIDEMLDVISGFAEVDEGEDFTTIITDDDTKLMIKDHNGMAFFSNKSEMLDKIPDNPVKALGELPSKFNISAKVFAQRIPEKMRDQVIDLIRQSSEDTFDNLDDDIQAEFQKKNLEMQIKQMEMLFKDSDSLTIGMAADQESKTLSMDIEFTALPDTKLAERMNITKADDKSRFTGFLMDGATFTQNGFARIHPEDAEQYATMLGDLKKAGLKELNQDSDMTEEEFNKVEKSLGELVEVITETLNDGVLDVGAVLVLEEGNVNFAAGGQISDPRKLEATIKDLVIMAEEELGDEIEVNLNSGTLVIGIGTKEAYVAGGSNPVELLKKAIDGKATTTDMMQFNVNIVPILKFAASLDGDPNIELMADALEEAGNDRLRLTSNMIDNGVKMRYELQDGVLGLIKVGWDAFQGGGAFPDDDF